MTNEEAHLVARVINACSSAGEDSGGWQMVKVRAALVLELQNALARVRLDPGASPVTPAMQQAVDHALRRAL